MKHTSRLLLPVVFLAGLGLLEACIAVPTESGQNRFDGTYDYAVVVRGQTLRATQAFFIQNGVVSNSEGSFSGAVVDNFGNIEFTGPCPDASSLSGGLFTGVVHESSLSNFGEGTWDCGTGSGDRWSILNGS